MSKGKRALRYATIDDMPDGMRKAFTSQQHGPPVWNGSTSAERGPDWNGGTPVGDGGKWQEPAPVNPWAGVANDPVQGPARKAARRGDPEHQEQKTFITRIDELAKLDPRYQLAARRTFAIPNGGKRGKGAAGKLRAEGVRSGVSDLFCAVPSGQWHGLFIEMKAGKNTASMAQQSWLTDSENNGYAAHLAYSAGAALDIWKRYVEGTF